MSNNENLVKQDISELWKTNTDIKLIGEIVKFLQVFIPATLAKWIVTLVLAIVGLGVLTNLWLFLELTHSSA